MSIPLTLELVSDIIEPYVVVLALIKNRPCVTGGTAGSCWEFDSEKTIVEPENVEGICPTCLAWRVLELDK